MVFGILIIRSLEVLAIEIRLFLRVISTIRTVYYVDMSIKSWDLLYLFQEKREILAPQEGNKKLFSEGTLWILLFQSTTATNTLDRIAHIFYVWLAHSFLYSNYFIKFWYEAIVSFVKWICEFSSFGYNWNDFNNLETYSSFKGYVNSAVKTTWGYCLF